METVVVTLIGPDRPGLVEAVSRLVKEHDGHWVESRMAHLAGQFAGILEVRVPAGAVGGLVGAMRELAGEAGLQVEARAGGGVGDAAGGSASQVARRVRFELMGQDRPGIVAEVSRRLAARGVNVEELETECVSAPMSGELLFKAVAELALPEGVTLEVLRADFESLAEDFVVDVELRESGGV